MAKTIVFKPEFEAKLKKLKIKTKFVSNIKNRTISNKAFKEHIIYLNSKSNWNNFISNAFLWDYTPEKYVFWEEISKL